MLYDLKPAGEAERRGIIIMQNYAETVRHQEDESAIRGLLRQLLDGWNQGSGDAFAAPFAEDADFVGFDGTYFKGRQEIASFHKMPPGRHACRGRRSG
jgi:hypothetical protein